MKLLFEAIGNDDDMEHVHRIASLSKPSASNISTVGLLRDGDFDTVWKDVPTESTKENKLLEGRQVLHRGLDEEIWAPLARSRL